MNRNFYYLWASQIFSQLTIHVMNFTLLFHIFSKTSSSIAVSFLWIAYAIPALLVGPIAAGMVDMMDRRKVLIFTNFSQFATIFIYALFYEKFLFLSYAVVAVYSFFNQFYVPAEAASLPLVVTRKKLARANSLFFLTQQAAILLGFGSAGILNDFLRFRGTLFLASGLVFVAFLVVTLLPKTDISYRLSKDLEKRTFIFFKRLYDGYKFIRYENSVLYPFLLLMGVQISVSVVTVLVPAITSDLLSIPRNLVGILVVAPVGLGALIGAYTIPKFLSEGVRKKRSIEISLFIITAAIFIVSYFIPIFPYKVRIIFSIILFMIAGISAVGIIVPSQTFLQEATPEKMRGRVFGNFWFLTTATSIIPVLFSATLTELLGVRVLLTIIGSIGLLIFFFSKKYGQDLLENHLTKI